MRKRGLAWILAVGVCLSATACKMQDTSGSAVHETENESVVMTTMASSEAMTEEETESEEESVSFGEDMKAFADEIKTAVEAKDMKSLELLLSYPTYIGRTGSEGIIINSTEEFMALSPSKIFGDKLVAAISQVDTSTLEISKAGVVMGEGTPNITFNVLEGNCFGITGINE